MIGKSVHSQRVEWLKHNVVYAITALYYKNVQYLEEIMKRWVNEVHIGALQYTFVPRANRALDFLQIAETPIHFPVRKTDLQNSFGSCGWISKRDNYALTKWVLFLFPRWNVFTLFRFLVSIWGRIYDYSKHFYSKHRCMWWHNKILVLQF